MGVASTLAAQCRSTALAALAAVVLAALVTTTALAQRSEVIDVRGAVQTPLHLNVEALKSFPAEQIGSFSQARRTEAGEVASTVRGVRLTALLDQAALVAADKNDWKATVVVATANDGYRVVFSWPELFNSALGADVLVLFERDGKPLGNDEGSIALISAGDRRTGPRHVRWLKSLDVRILPP